MKAMDRSGDCRRLHGGRDACLGGQQRSGRPYHFRQVRPIVIDKQGMQLRKSSRPLMLNSPSSPDMFGTVALKAGVTFYDARFRRVASADTKDPLVTSLAHAAAGLEPVAKLQMVQREVNQTRALDA